MLNYYYKDTIRSFKEKGTAEIIGTITLKNQFDSTPLQNKSWAQEIDILKASLGDYEGTIFFEFSIPRMGKRIDTLIIIGDVVFVIEFKVGESSFLNYQIEQVWDYALDLKNFHKPSHSALLAPILIATEANKSYFEILTTSHNDNLLLPLRLNRDGLTVAMKNILQFHKSKFAIDGNEFAFGSYSPTPTIIEAAISLYNNHSVDDITRSDAEAKNLSKTTAAISEIISIAQLKNKKILCLVTGVPGAGKTIAANA